VADPEMAMEKAELKQLLMRSKKEPVNCAVAQSKDPAFALVLLHKIKQPKALSKQLEGDFKDAKNHRWGEAFVDVDDNPKLVVFTLNKPAPGIARKLVKSLKPTGFTKVRLQFEDGSAPEEHDDEAAEEAASQPAAAPAAASGEAPPAPPAPLQQAPAGPDAGELGRTLAQLIPRVQQVEQNARAAMAKLATDANVNLKTGNLKTAADLIAQLRQALDGAPAGAPAGAMPPQAAPQPAAQPQGAANGQADPAKGAVAYAKSRLAWIATRQKIESEVGKLGEALKAAYAEDGLADQVTAQFQERVAPLLATFDGGLADTLDAATNATDPQKRAALVADARAQIVRYQTFVAGEPLFKQLQDNPFVKIAVVPTLEATLTALSAALR